MVYPTGIGGPAVGMLLAQSVRTGSTAVGEAVDAHQAAIDRMLPAQFCQRLPMRIASDRNDLLAQLEARQDEALSQLETLEARLEKLLAEFSPPAAAKPQSLADAA